MSNSYISQGSWSGSYEYPRGHEHAGNSVAFRFDSLAVNGTLTGAGLDGLGEFTMKGSSKGNKIDFVKTYTSTTNNNSWRYMGNLDHKAKTMKGQWGPVHATTLALLEKEYWKGEFSFKWQADNNPRSNKFPKVIALDTDMTIFEPMRETLSEALWGKGSGACKPTEDNIIPVNGSDTVLMDKSSPYLRIALYKDVPRIITDIIRNGAKLAIVTQNPWKAGSDRVLYWYQAEDPRDNTKKGIASFVEFNETGEHPNSSMERIQACSGADYADMILYDDQPEHNLVRIEKGVIFQLCRDKKGLTWANYQEGLSQWRRLQALRHPYLGQSLSSYNEPMFIGYSGMDEQTVGLLTKGKHRVDLKESARWGHAMYIADDIRIANYFADWIKADAFGQNAKTYVCEIWVRDRSKFLATPKVWWPEEFSWQNDVHKQSREKISIDQENRDRRSAGWGVPTPHILFSRHFWMRKMPIPQTRWNEMVVYTHIQQALILALPLTEQEVKQKMSCQPQPQPYHMNIKAWNTKMPDETIAEFTKKGENWY